MTERRQAAERRGRWAEWLCRVHLMLTGWRILYHRHRARPGSGAGEIDLVARRGDIIAIIEVKARPTYNAALESIDERQQQRIVRAAEQLLAQHPDWQGCNLRFDVMAVVPWRWPKHATDAWRPS